MKRIGISILRKIRERPSGVLNAINLVRNFRNGEWGFMRNNELLRTQDMLTGFEREECQALGIAFFPELFSSAQSKYHEFANFLVDERNIIPIAVRDLFSAGGRSDLYTPVGQVIAAPRIIAHAWELRSRIRTLLFGEYLPSTWSKGLSQMSDTDRIGHWKVAVQGNLGSKSPHLVIFDAIEGGF